MRTPVKVIARVSCSAGQLSKIPKPELTSGAGRCGDESSQGQRRIVNDHGFLGVTGAVQYSAMAINPTEHIN